MKYEQIEFHEAITPVPPLWQCKETCSRFGELVDSPKWWFGEERCLLCTAPHLHVTEFDNRAMVWCDLYEEAKA